MIGRIAIYNAGILPYDNMRLGNCARRIGASEMTPSELRIHLDVLDMSARRFANYVGSNERTVRRWIGGEQDIPPWVPVLIGLLLGMTDSRGGAHYTKMLAARAEFLDSFASWIHDASPSAALAYAEAKVASNLLEGAARGAAGNV